MDEEFEEIQTLDIKKMKDKKKDKKKDKEKKKEEEANEVKIQEANDKKYLQLLKRISETLLKNNPDLAEHTKILLKPPQVEKEGSKKIVIKNFKSLCKQLDRPTEHVMNFFLQDLGGRSGSIGNKGLIIKNVLTQKNVENLFRKYISEFVQCQLCRGQKTELIKDDKMRLWKIHCNSCKSERSVRTIRGAQKKCVEQQVNSSNEDQKEEQIQ